MSTVQDDLDNLGKSIANDAKKNALPNKKTGKLDRSIKYQTSFISNDKFQIVINEKSYGKWLNDGHGSFAGTLYMDKAVKSNIDKGINNIINTITGDILNNIIPKK